ncbi:carboxylating nicotinate-nucleotide diphosphorylase [Pararhizobium mangrovi]|uniref:Probable nicotinate-nucleotide pyrophosphorylase [carboxylating] n=1 Tax=Pararhizobium mangrovi TaxID=2590452 RepID=A0A506U7Y2_9HYPH|nr:carboxylating nicotinate-nucleotide diphosphorylase [Pararhizobium mangrovi]TPW29588.1 carboxylating nicotinate-nucleotide diphosphorylase [Pararhizobium mangrovi]
MPQAHLPSLPAPLVEAAVRSALLEDLGRAGDVTSIATITPRATARGRIVSRERLVVCGLDFVRSAFFQMNPAIRFAAECDDGRTVEAGETIATVEGPARDVLSGERVALNYLCHLSAISTYTGAFAAKIAHTAAAICCTRKTVPGMRAFQKYAVRIGGGINHRFGLDDAILIKDNHIAVCGGVRSAVEQAKAYAGHLLALEVEVDTLEQLDEALAAGAGAILLDNFTPQDLRRAVERTAGRAKLEASGGIAFDTVVPVAETGVDYISSSKITMAPPAVDIGFDIEVA